MPHASPTIARPVRFTPIVVLLVAVLVGAGGMIVRAEIGGISKPAEVALTATRITTTGVGVLFPIDPSPKCEVFNNFGGFSKNYGSGGHQGVDIGAQIGQEVYAVESGVLYRDFSGAGSGIGWGLLSDTDTVYRYFHLDAKADGLSVGDRVTEGQLIGYVGDTGNATPGGWHLHFEVRPGPAPHATPVDPVPLLDIPATCNVY